jgi:hypothetical protein
LYWNGGSTTLELESGLLRGLTASGDHLLIETPGPRLIDINGGSTAFPIQVPFGTGALSASGASVIGVVYSNNVNNLARVDTNTGTVALLGELGDNDSWVDGGHVNPDGSAMVGAVPGGLGSRSGNVFRWTPQQGLVFGLAGAPTNGRVRPTALSADGTVTSGLLGLTTYFRWTEAEGYHAIAQASELQAKALLSTDGSVVSGSLEPTGESDSSSFRWTAATGAVELAPSERTYPTYPVDMSDDGNVIVMQSWEGVGNEAPSEQIFVWDAANGTRTLEQVLQARGVTVEGWEFTYARVLSGDGKVLLGIGQCGGVPTLYRVVLSG